MKVLQPTGIVIAGVERTFNWNMLSFGRLSVSFFLNRTILIYVTGNHYTDYLIITKKNWYLHENKLLKSNLWDLSNIYKGLFSPKFASTLLREDVYVWKVRPKVNFYIMKTKKIAIISENRRLIKPFHKSVHLAFTLINKMVEPLVNAEVYYKL